MRVTWMVAFWRDIQARPRPAPSQAPPQGPAGERKRTTQGAAEGGEMRGEANSGRQPPPSGAGAAQPFPEMPPPDCCGTAPSWPELFRKKPEGWGDDATGGGGGGGGGGDGASGVPVTPVPIPQVWEDVDPADNRRAGAGVRRLKRLPEYDLCFQGF